MSNTQSFVQMVQSRLDAFLEARTSILSRVSTETASLSEFSGRFLSGGKRFRARFCYEGWQAVGGRAAVSASEPIVGVSSSLELFHAAALVHDDIIDNSDTRRGSPSAHRSFTAHHRTSHWTGDAEEYGRSAALLLGDLLLGWSDELLDESLLEASPGTRSAVRDVYIRMRTEVTAGQFLDIVEEQAWRTRDDESQLVQAETVAIYKSAKYSIEAPLLLGAVLAGASHDQMEVLRAFGLPLGFAFQMRDDLLGVFGDTSVTGKPSGDDLREGKRTVLIGMARRAATPSQRTLIDSLLGNPELTTGQVEELQHVIRSTGAVTALEDEIGNSVERAVGALNNNVLSEDSLARLRPLAFAAAERNR